MSQSLKNLLLCCWAVFYFLQSASSADELREWPLRNGDFSTFSVSGTPEERFLETGDGPTYDLNLERCLPARWHPETISGKHEFHKAEAPKLYPELPYHVFAKLNQPSAAVIETTESGCACFTQELQLMPGDYRLEATATGTPGAEAFVSFLAGGVEIAGEPVDLDKARKQIDLDVLSPGGEATVRLCSTASANQSVKFHAVELEIKSLESSAISFDDGSKLGGIVLPLEPTLAEEYAGFELQRYILEMTGNLPGIKGRDRTARGSMIYLGRAAPRKIRGRLENQPDDSYLIEDGGRKISLAGKTDAATLYAAYDFLKQQGCRWIVPGSQGETVPKRESLSRAESRMEIPDYDCRGYHAMTQDYFLKPNGDEAWVAIDLDEYLDWSVRNRMNGIRFSGIRSYDFGPHRGRGWIQISNHSFNDMVASHEKHFDEHPEWYPLLNGERVPVSHHKPFFPNQLCLSSQSLRDYTVNLATEFFDTNPEMRMFPLIPMDGRSLWCECDECKALDPPGVDWTKHYDEGFVVGVTDRYVNYANEIAARVSEAHPHKRILIQAYSYTIRPPKHEKVHENVVVRYANLSRPGQGPLGKSILDESVPMWDTWRNQLAGWRGAGARMSHYNYMDWENTDVSLFWFFTLSDVTRALHRNYNFRQLFGETEPNQRISFMMFQVLAETLWDVDTDYKAVIRDVCNHFYGPVADEMIAYNLIMDRAIIESDAWKDWKPVEGKLWGEGYRNVRHREIPFEVLELGREILENLVARVRDDPTVTLRIARARLGHAVLTYLRAQNEINPTVETRDIAREAYDLVHSMRRDHGVLIKRFSAVRLKKFHYPSLPEGDGE